MQTIESQRAVVAEEVWSRLEVAHRSRIAALTKAHESRAARGEKHPVEDFLFTYYPFKPAVLKRWHPGIGVALAGGGARAFLNGRYYALFDEGVAADPGLFPKERHEGVSWILGLLRATESRPPAFGCFGLHEWAMVYGQSQDELRHASWPLRLSPREITRVVEAGPVRCTHFDAFRFFTQKARALNRVHPRRETIHSLDQRGCLHVNMDLYKWAAKLLPFAPSGLVADAFELARDIRGVDMRASPYDLRPLGLEPIAIETPEGRSQYELLQRRFSARGQPIRARLIAVCEAMAACWRA